MSLPPLEVVGECLIWEGRLTSKGYGVFDEKGADGVWRTVRAHRRAYEALWGPVPEGLQVHHACDVPACYAPLHLWAGTQDENNKDRARKGRTKNGKEGTTRCKRGHEFTPENTVTYSNGQRTCRTCRDERMARYVRKEQRNVAA